MATLFISDLHLCAQRPAMTALFLAFLRDHASAAEALYVLGDLFEYWVGDDAAAQTEFQPMIAGLRAATAGGTPVYVMHGNRDFLLGEQFERDTGCRLLPEMLTLDLYGERVLLMHGDTLCTDDAAYQDFRRLVRAEAWVKDFLSKSLAERDAIVRGYREMSKAAVATKKPEIMDVNQQAVENAMRTHGVHHLIHGHTHRPAQHEFLLDGRPARRTVLGDWYEHGSMLACHPHGCALQRLP